MKALCQNKYSRLSIFFSNKVLILFTLTGTSAFYQFSQVKLLPDHIFCPQSLKCTHFRTVSMLTNKQLIKV